MGEDLYGTVEGTPLGTIATEVSYVAPLGNYLPG